MSMLVISYLALGVIISIRLMIKEKLKYNWACSLVSPLEFVFHPCLMRLAAGTSSSSFGLGKPSYMPT